MLDMLQVAPDNIIVAPVEKQQTAAPGLDKHRQPLQNIPDPNSRHAVNLPSQQVRWADRNLCLTAGQCLSHRCLQVLPHGSGATSSEASWTQVPAPPVLPGH